MTVDMLLALLKAGAILVGQESVQLATKQAYEALRAKLTQILGRPTVDAAATGAAGGVSAAAIRDKLVAASASEREGLDAALATLADDPALQALVPGRLYASLREARFSGAITIVAEEHDQVVVDARRAQAASFSLSSKKSPGTTR